MNIIAIDCGASFIKAALFDAEGEIIKKRHEHRKNSGTRKDILALASVVQEIFDEFLQETNGDIRLCISNEMHGFLLAKSDGMPVTDYISWQKEYGKIPVPGGSACEILSAPEYREDIVKTGMPLRSNLPSVNLLYWKKAVWEKKAKRFESPVYFYTLGDYILRMISGIQPPCHLTNAAATGLVDLNLNDWNKKLVKIVSPDGIIFPKIDSAPIEFKKLEKKVVALPAIGDQQAALYGANLCKENQLSFNMGTGGQVSKIIPAPIFSDNYQVRPFFGGKYIKTVPHIPCGRALNVYFRFFDNLLKQFGITKTEEEIWRVLLQAEENSCECTISCDLSFFENPITLNIVGNIQNIAEYSFSVGNLMRAVFSQLANNFLTVAERLNDDSSSVEKIIFSGGVAGKIKSIRERISEKFSCECEVAFDETLKGLFRYGKGFDS